MSLRDYLYYEEPGVTLYRGDALMVLRSLPPESIQACVTSPPYWGLRDYGVPGQLGLERTPKEYVAKLVEVFREVRRVLRDDGTLWLNLGDSYAGSGKGPSNNSPLDRPYRGMSNIAAAPNRWLSVPDGIKQKDLVGIPWMVAFALRADGWYLRSDIIWAKPNPMPESVTDRPTKAHEYLFLMTKSERYYYDINAIREPMAYPLGPNAPESIASPYGQGFTRRAASHKGSTFTRGKTGVNGLGRVSDAPREDNPLGRNRRSVWTIATQPYPEAHFATFPVDLVTPCVLAGSKAGDTVLDPFIGSGTVALVAKELGRRGIGVDLNEKYLDLAVKRLRQEVLAL